MKPALSPKEWREVRDPDINWSPSAYGDVIGDAHGVAAACLYGKPFGFTWEMVDAVRESAHGGRFVFSEEGAKRLTELTLAAADRIEALLPPREQP